MGNTVATGSATPAAGRRHPVTVKSTERKEADNHGYKLQCAVSGMRGWRPTMEDQHIMQVELSKELADHCLFAIFDGHGGGLTSTYLEQKFLQVLMQQPTIKQYVGLCPHGHMSRSDVGGVKMLQKALKETFEQLDQELLALQNQVNSIVARRHEGRLQQLLKQQQPRQQTTAASNGSSSPESFSSPLTSTDATITPPTLPPPPIERSGSTAIVVLLTPTHIVTANTGDSRAMLRRHGLVVPLSFDHKPNDIPERRRIVRASGFVRHRRVDGDLAVSRAFGDFSYKNANHKVIVTPEFTVYPRDSSGMNSLFWHATVFGTWPPIRNAVSTCKPCWRRVKWIWGTFAKTPWICVWNARVVTT